MARPARRRIMTNERSTTKAGAARTETAWTPIVIWRGLSEICNRHLHTGSRVSVTGRLKTRAWEDDAGTTQYHTEVQADTVIVLDGRQL